MKKVAVDEASDAYEAVVRHMSRDERQRVETGEVSANEYAKSPKLAVAVKHWRALLKEQGKNPGPMNIRV